MVYCIIEFYKDGNLIAKGTKPIRIDLCAKAGKTNYHVPGSPSWSKFMDLGLPYTKYGTEYTADMNYLRKNYSNLVKLGKSNNPTDKALFNKKIFQLSDKVIIDGLVEKKVDWDYSWICEEVNKREEKKEDEKETAKKSETKEDKDNSFWSGKESSTNTSNASDKDFWTGKESSSETSEASDHNFWSGKTSNNTTKSNETNKGTFIDNRDGQKYKWVKIGNQVWMAENLNYNTGSNSCCYANKSTNCNKYGRLYTLNAAKNACPAGWHLPSDNEWKQLEIYLGISKEDIDREGSRGINEGNKLKSISGWDSNHGTDDYGFNALPGGERGVYGGFSWLGSYGNWWSATNSWGSSSAWYRSLSDNHGDVYRKSYDGSYSVRCIKN